MERERERERVGYRNRDAASKEMKARKREIKTF